jgi:hypothetical protein
MTNPETTVELTVEQKMALAIAKAKEARKKDRDTAKLALLENGNYATYLATVEDEAEQVTMLTAIMEQLNQIKPIETNDGSKYSVNIFPVAEYAFGPVMSRVIGIVTGSSAMFTDERQAEFKAITKMTHLLASKARDAIGSPAYYSKGILANAIPGDGTSITTALTAVCDVLGIDLEYVNKVNQTTINRWFKVAQDKAEKQYAEFKKIEVIDSANCFILED